jgi:hypothetical protein
VREGREKWAGAGLVGWKRRWAARERKKKRRGKRKVGRREVGPHELLGRGLERKGRGEGREGWGFLFFFKLLLQTFKSLNSFPKISNQFKNF